MQEVTTLRIRMIKQNDSLHPRQYSSLPHRFIRQPAQLGSGLRRPPHPTNNRVLRKRKAAHITASFARTQKLILVELLG